MRDAIDKPCPLCGRPLGGRVERHHLIPKSRRGKLAHKDVPVVELHRACHRMIHKIWTDGELARDFHTIEKIRTHPAIQRYITWIKDKPGDFHVPVH